MNLDILKARRLELENSEQQLSNSWQIVQGHKAEVDHWIAECEKALLEETKVDEPLVENPELPVE